MDEETRKLLEEAMKYADPEQVKKYGNPLDEDDPRMWTPSKRFEANLPLEDQVKYLGLDIEGQSVVLTKLLTENNTLRELLSTVLIDQLKELMKTDPDAALKKMAAYGSVINETTGALKKPTGSYGPFDNDPNSPVRYAGSTSGIKPDQMVDTPNGMIRADEIPGYKNDPNWKPSPDWVAANCMCEEHRHMRETSGNYNPFNINPDDQDKGTGFYL